MFRTLLVARWRHDVNFVRTQFNGRTLLLLGLIALWFGYQTLRSFSDIGIQPAKLNAWSWGERLLVFSPLIFLVLRALARHDARATPGVTLLRSLPIPTPLLDRWLVFRHGMRTGTIALLLAAPALLDRRSGWLVAAAIVVGTVAIDFLARIVKLESAGPTRAGTIRSPIAIRGGGIIGLLLRDVVFLLRASPSVIAFFAIAVILEVILAIAVHPVMNALIALTALQLLHAAFQLSLLERLFVRDRGVAGLLRALPIGGSRLLRARALLTAGLLVIPALFPSIVVLARGARLVPFAAYFSGAAIGIPVVSAFLFADVHVALFPRTQVASFLLMAAMVATVLFWFFVPFVTPLLLAVLLVVWGKGAAAAFDRMEPE